MIGWLAITVALLMWNVVYCVLKIVVDLRSPKPASGVFGIFAALGSVSALSIVLFMALAAASGVV